MRKRGKLDRTALAKFGIGGIQGGPEPIVEEGDNETQEALPVS